MKNSLLHTCTAFSSLENNTKNQEELQLPKNTPNEPICCPLCPTISCLFNEENIKAYLSELRNIPHSPFHPNMNYTPLTPLTHILEDYLVTNKQYSTVSCTLHEYNTENEEKLTPKSDDLLQHCDFTQTSQETLEPSTPNNCLSDWELRGSKFIHCLCKKRFGLQDFCERTGCMGSPECLAIPPQCEPSRYDKTPIGERCGYVSNFIPTIHDYFECCIKCLQGQPHYVCRTEKVIVVHP